MIYFVSIFLFIFIYFYIFYAIKMYESSNFKCLQFLLCLHFAVVNSEYVSVVLKPKQVVCLEAAYLGRDLLAVLPTGYGK